jgi:hypothetical protein
MKCGCWQRSRFSSKTVQLQGASNTSTRLPSPQLLLTLMLVTPSRSAIPRACAGGSGEAIPAETLGGRAAVCPLCRKAGGGMRFSEKRRRLISKTEHSGGGGKNKKGLCDC